MKFHILYLLIALLALGCTEGSQNNKRENLTKDYKDLTTYTSKADLESAAKENDPEAIFVLGSMYATGEGAEVNQKRAFELFEQAAKLGSSNAILQLGLIFRNGNNYIKKDDRKALEYFEAGAKKGIPQPYIMLV